MDSLEVDGRGERGGGIGGDQIATRAWGFRALRAKSK